MVVCQVGLLTAVVSIVLPRSTFSTLSFVVVRPALSASAVLKVSLVPGNRDVEIGVS